MKRKNTSEVFDLSISEKTAVATVFRRNHGCTPVDQETFHIRERRRVTQLLRRTRIKGFVGTIMVIVLLGCGVAAVKLTAGFRLSADSDYERPW